MFLIKGVDLGKTGFAGAVTVVNQSRFFLVLTLVVGLLAGVALSRITPQVFKASAAFVSASQLEGDGNSLASLSSAANRFGLDFGGRGNNLSPLFPWILDSRELGARILLSEFSDTEGSTSPLLDALVPAGGDSLRRLETGLAVLRTEVLRHRFDNQSGVTTLSVVLEDAGLARDVAIAFVENLDEFNKLARKKQAQDQVDFLTNRLRQIEAEFRTSEIALRDFRIANRSLQGSPQLMLEEARLLREQQLNQDLFLSLKTKLEIVRLESIKDLPLIVVIDPPFAPSKHFAPRPLRLIAVSGLLGLVTGLILIFLWNQILLLKGQMGRVGSSVAEKV